jgi:hypothetical protein
MAAVPPIPTQRAADIVAGIKLLWGGLLAEIAPFGYDDQVAALWLAPDGGGATQQTASANIGGAVPGPVTTSSRSTTTSCRPMALRPVDNSPAFLNPPPLNPPLPSPTPSTVCGKQSTDSGLRVGLCYA